MVNKHFFIAPIIQQTLHRFEPTAVPIFLRSADIANWQADKCERWILVVYITDCHCVVHAMRTRWRTRHMELRQWYLQCCHNFAGLSSYCINGCWKQGNRQAQHSCLQLVGRDILPSVHNTLSVGLHSNGLG